MASFKSITIIKDKTDDLRLIMKNNNTQWRSDLYDITKHVKIGNMLKKYSSIFSESYIKSHDPAQALTDISKIEYLQTSKARPIEIDCSLKSNTDLRIQLYQLNDPVPLSDSLPIFENLGLRTITEVPYQFILQRHQRVWIHDFHVIPRMPIDLLVFNNVKSHVEEAFMSIMSGEIENDGLNQLVLSAGFNVREVVFLRACTKYLLQTGFRFSQHYIEGVLSQYATVTKLLIALFYARFRLSHRKKSNRDQKIINTDILNALEEVANLDDDNVLRAFFELIHACLRTNFFQKNADRQYKNYLSCKFDSSKVPGLSSDRPMFEIFVYAAHFEGIHLRGEKVARGGLRYSDRQEDFRTEVLGLMKAQVVKNALIVPSGAKGGFVVKRLPLNVSRESVQKEVILCYQSFIRGLLDLTDNIEHDAVLPPKDCVCYDAPDPYLVVAADKGTASFSDIANAISAEYSFWLGDAFASGGSAGYDHKKMGITARGAWESVKRQFYERGIVIDRDLFSVVGVGDMSGDVFGNGMLYTKHMRLIAAFDHRHIFIDPDPDFNLSFQERQRIFMLPRSSWDDYNKALISPGGGVFSRSSKSIAITEPIRQALDIHDQKLTPNELIIAILKAPVDLLYNGGIGTYVKASTESNAEVMDKTNDYCRVNASDLRCKIVAEGGNLGVTKCGRVEFALTGGSVCGDFIDNAGGVNCSDNEVNIKILLNKEMANGRLTFKRRNQLLKKMQEEVAHIVLRDNYEQALILSMSVEHTMKYDALYREYVKSLETLAQFDREIECFPDDKKLLERNSSGFGLTRPEMALLLAYTRSSSFFTLTNRLCSIPVF